MFQRSHLNYQRKVYFANKARRLRKSRRRKGASGGGCGAQIRNATNLSCAPAYSLCVSIADDISILFHFQ